MNTYLALLRGINVGGNKKVAMPELKKVFESLGYSDVITYINSGNVIFKSGAKSASMSNFASSSEPVSGSISGFKPNTLASTIKDTPNIAIIEHALQEHFGFEIKTLIRDAKNIQTLCKHIPTEYENNAEQKTDILFLWDDFDKEPTLEQITTNPQVDNLLYVSGAIIWHIKKCDYSKSGLNKFIGSTVYAHMTARNVNTVRKLNELMSFNK